MDLARSPVRGLFGPLSVGGISLIIIIISSVTPALAQDAPFDPAACRPVPAASIARGGEGVPRGEPIAVDVASLREEAGARRASADLGDTPIACDAPLLAVLGEAAALAAAGTPVPVRLYGVLAPGEGPPALRVRACRVAFPGGPTFPDDVPRLIGDLGDDSWAARDGASRWLVRFGDAAVSWLALAVGDADPERAWRAATALDRIRWRSPVALSTDEAAFLDAYRDADRDGRHDLLALADEALGEPSAPANPAVLAVIVSREDDGSLRLGALVALARRVGGPAAPAPPPLSDLLGRAADRFAGTERLGPDLGWSLAWVLASAGRPEEALARVEAEAAAAAGDTRLLAARAQILQAMERLREAAEAWRAVYDAGMGRASRETGPEGSLPILSEALDAYFASADCLDLAGEREAAVAALGALLADEAPSPADPRLAIPVRYWIRGAAWFRDRGLDAEARGTTLAGLDRYPGDPELLLERAIDLAAEGRDLAAFDLLQDLAARGRTAHEEIAATARRVLGRLGLLDLWDERFEREVLGERPLDDGRLLAARAFASRGLLGDARRELHAGRLLGGGPVYSAERARLELLMGGDEALARRLLDEARRGRGDPAVRAVIADAEARLSGRAPPGEAPLLWEVRRPVPAGASAPHLALLPGAVLGAAGPAVFALDPETGRLLWQAEPSRTTVSGIAAAPDGSVLAVLGPAGREASVRLLDGEGRETASLRLSVSGALRAPPAIDGDRAALVFQDPAGRATLVLLRSMHEAWRASFDAYAATPPSFVGDFVAAGTDFGDVQAFDAAVGGRHVRMFSVYGPVSAVFPAPGGGGLLVVAEEALFLLDAGGGAPLRISLPAPARGVPVLDGSTLHVPVGDGDIARWDGGDRVEIEASPGRTAGTLLAAAPDGALLALSGSPDYRAGEQGTLSLLAGARIQWQAVIGPGGALAADPHLAVAAAIHGREVRIAAFRLEASGTAEPRPQIILSLARRLDENRQRQGAARLYERYLDDREHRAAPEPWISLIRCYLADGAPAEAAHALGLARDWVPASRAPDLDGVAAEVEAASGEGQ